jgi:hypothetical protein
MTHTAAKPSPTAYPDHLDNGEQRPPEFQTDAAKRESHGQADIWHFAHKLRSITFDSLDANEIPSVGQYA